MEKKKKSLFSRFKSFVKGIFLTGLFAILPLTATVFIVHFTYTLITQWLAPLKQIEPEFLQKIPGAEFLLVMLFIFFIGILFNLFVIEPIIHSIERLINKIPFIRTVYSSAKKLVNFFNVPKHKKEFERQVVLIEYPRPNYYNIGFLLGPATDGFEEAIKEKKQKPNQEYIRVFMPTAPNPTNGYFFIVPKTSVIPIDITFEEAIKTVVSCGLITPDYFKKLHPKRP